MFQSPDHYHNLSLRLSEVLSDIGVNERIVMRRRRTWLLQETIKNIGYQLEDEDYLDIICFIFGSQTEASTTPGLHSDIDILFSHNMISALQDWSEWKVGKLQLLMVQDETTSPGYCLLQWVRSDLPLPKQDIQDQDFTTDSRGRVLMRHAFCFPIMDSGSIRHGPAKSINRGPGQYDEDYVTALSCSSWPKEAEPWLQQQNVSGWPTADVKRYAVEHGCFIVPVASHTNVTEDTEWRISTSHAERCLMFSLNMTQMRCYILMKMILKTYLKSMCVETISSFMFKTVLFHRIANTRPAEWTDSNLLPCFNQCLQYLLHCILTENCPHFIIPGNNLLAGKLSFQTKQQVIEIMMTLTANIEQSLLGISVDELGNRLHVKSGTMITSHVTPSELVTATVLVNNVLWLASVLQFEQKIKVKNNSHNNVASVYQYLAKIVTKLCTIYLAGNRLMRAACCLYVPSLCTIIGSIIASVNIHHSQPVSPAALQWFSAGLNSDFSSSRLKLASALYCAGQYEQCETILVHLNRQLEESTMVTTCMCVLTHLNLNNSEEFERICLEKNDDSVIKQNMAFCIRFLPCEIYCLPKELRYEMFRSTVEDLPYRDERDDWMDWAVIDSIPFLYFLQYKVYSQLNRPALQQQALLNLDRTINTDQNLGHRETALNFLGQCMKEDNRYDEALCCYMMSLSVRPRNNAAKWLICTLLAGLFN